MVCFKRLLTIREKTKKFKSHRDVGWRRKLGVHRRRLRERGNRIPRKTALFEPQKGRRQDEWSNGSLTRRRGVPPWEEKKSEGNRKKKPSAREKSSGKKAKAFAAFQVGEIRGKLVLWQGGESVWYKEGRGRKQMRKAGPQDGG